MGEGNPPTVVGWQAPGVLASSVAAQVEDSAPGTGGAFVVLGVLDRGAFDAASIDDELNELDIAAYGRTSLPTCWPRSAANERASRAWASRRAP